MRSVRDIDAPGMPLVEVDESLQSAYSPSLSFLPHPDPRLFLSLRYEVYSCQRPYIEILNSVRDKKVRDKVGKGCKGEI